MFLIICLHGSRRADFSLFPPMPDRNNTNRVRHARQDPAPAFAQMFPAFPALFTARNAPMIDHIARRPPSHGGQKENPASLRPNFPSIIRRFRGDAPRCARCRAVLPDGVKEASLTLRAPRPRLRAGNASLVIQGFSSRSRVRPQAPWAACHRTWRRSLRCSPRPLSRVPCPR